MVFHSKYSLGGATELLKCKALSRVIGHVDITRNANKVILINHKAPLNAFGGNIHGMALMATAKALAMDVDSPSALLNRFTCRKLLGSLKDVILQALDSPKDQL